MLPPRFEWITVSEVMEGSWSFSEFVSFRKISSGLTLVNLLAHHWVALLPTPEKAIRAGLFKKTTSLGSEGHIGWAPFPGLWILICLLMIGPIWLGMLPIGPDSFVCYHWLVHWLAHTPYEFVRSDLLVFLTVGWAPFPAFWFLFVWSGWSVGLFCPIFYCWLHCLA